MNTTHWKTQAAWLWLPLFLVLCAVLGFYRSYAGPGIGAESDVTSCPDSSHLTQFLGCR
ncbi:hypothetical protein [Marmoricola sp. RAF53]|uniref:hypothetical protein n=1 Tax=Marmoricola sp. RAF53 TaxID=3233059 RepID=UPI003F9A5E35